MPATPEQLKTKVDENIDRYFKHHHEINRKEGYEYKDFPKMKYGRDGSQIIVDSPDAERQLPSGEFFDSPKDAKDAIEAKKESERAPGQLQSADFPEQPKKSAKP
jgi:nitric oxide reductase activation protein